MKTIVLFNSYTNTLLFFKNLIFFSYSPPVTRFLTSCRARKIFIFTCPSVTPTISAISLYESPSKSRSCIHVRWFSGSESITLRIRSRLSLCTRFVNGSPPVSGLSKGISSRDASCRPFLFMVSRERFRQMVIEKASILSISSHESRRFHTFIIVSCTISSASCGLRVMRRAKR